MTETAQPTPPTSARTSPEMPCPVCGAALHLVLHHDIPLYRNDLIGAPAWPGGGEPDYTPGGANTSTWEVVCEQDHTVWTNVDQIRADNAAGLTDDDETGDLAPIFRPEAMRRPSQEGARYFSDAVTIEEAGAWWAAIRNAETLEQVSAILDAG
jgi:hypothetical protein